MKFQNSLFEYRYNEYWDKNVVRLDETIRSTSLGLNLFENRRNVTQLIEAYQQHVLTILVNLDRQSYLFEDKKYVQAYMKDTVNQTVEDFSFYEKIFPESKEICSNFLKTLGVNSTLETEETSYVPMM
ncbi:hypothetical protein LEAN103870_14650 [Legionella anisa]|uniref:Bile acid beta-glucosidase n=1 Tax=Legionella anisa TaxID=28082 RepID=A0AAX0WV63_9GAMM|nr:hypothetical protein [Legionella anisa]AWN74159.1 hypothetical protein DLD14_10060 [Legionella anisa]KTC71443.1 bile acid beta-glucosidase [Legionella anisa]MBN5935186.1 hypothetical protein [Legionella anisa]MCW8425812.1 hypothetical protein [Legionella anisa]MCW8448757.1 hypothetical protein [Legionella anisa]